MADMREPGTGIPRTIIQTWKTEALPFPLSAFAKRLRALNPGFEYRLFSDADAEAFVRDDYPDFEPAWRALRTPVERADLFRVLAVHRFGGFYFDLDVIMNRPLDPLVEYSCVFPFENMADPYTAANFGITEQLGQYAFGAAPGHPLLRAYAENIRRVALDPLAGAPRAAIERYPSANEAVRIIMSTGPGMLGRTLGQQPELGRGMKVIAATPLGGGKRLKYCFGAFGSHAMLGTFGWRTGQKKAAGYRSVLKYAAWLRALTAAYRRASEVAACDSAVEDWSKPAPWALGQPAASRLPDDVSR
jgi:hypothetical protein